MIQSFGNTESGVSCIDMQPSIWVDRQKGRLVKRHVLEQGESNMKVTAQRGQAHGFSRVYGFPSRYDSRIFQCAFRLALVLPFLYRHCFHSVFIIFYPFHRIPTHRRSNADKIFAVYTEKVWLIWLSYVTKFHDRSIGLINCLKISAFRKSGCSINVQMDTINSDTLRKFRHCLQDEALRSLAAAMPFLSITTAGNYISLARYRVSLYLIYKNCLIAIKRKYLFSYLTLHNFRYRIFSRLFVPIDSSFTYS